MASADYYRRQAETCLRMSLLSSDLDETKRLLEIAEQYKAKADKAACPDGTPSMQPPVGLRFSPEGDLDLA